MLLNLLIALILASMVAYCAEKVPVRNLGHVPIVRPVLTAPKDVDAETCGVHKDKVVCHDILEER